MTYKETVFWTLLLLLVNLSNACAFLFLHMLWVTRPIQVIYGRLI